MHHTDQSVALIPKAYSSIVVTLAGSFTSASLQSEKASAPILSIDLYWDRSTVFNLEHLLKAPPPIKLRFTAGSVIAVKAVFSKAPPPIKLRFTAGSKTDTTVHVYKC